MRIETTEIYQGNSKVIRFFEQISAIPRESGKEKAISDFIVNFAHKRECTVKQDSSYNLIIRKAASKGYEKAPTVMIQGHLDMVCEKNRSTDHDFSKDPIRLRQDGDNIYAVATTLGADNGLAIAYAMALLDSENLEHPELEIVFTTEEETSMMGALNLDANGLKGRMMINLDSDREGILYASCAGGASSSLTLPIHWEDILTERTLYKIKLSGFKGGHSGDDIIYERGNANKILGRILDDLRSSIKYDIVTLNGGTKPNAIPRESETILLIEERDIADIRTLIANWNQLLREEYMEIDPSIRVEGIAGEYCTIPHKCFSTSTKNKVIDALLLLPNGILSMHPSLEKLVRSSINLGIVTTMESEVQIECLVRSSVRTLRDHTLNQVKVLAEYLGCGFHLDSYFPEWPYRHESKIRDIFQQVYVAKYGKQMEIKAVHAGLECGYFMEKMPYLDTVSYGPDIFNMHTPNEHFSISSVERTWDFLIDVLRAIKDS